MVFALSLFFLQAGAQTRERKCNLTLLGGFSTYKGDLGDNMTTFNAAIFEQNPQGGLSFSHYINRTFDITAMEPMVHGDTMPTTILYLKAP